MVEQVKTGIEGLDEVLNGGLVRDSAVLVSGNPGTGKSILALEFVYHGVEEHDEPGIYLTFEETKDDLRISAESLGMDRWQEFVDEGLIKVYDKTDVLDEDTFGDTIDVILEDLLDDRFRRFVLDSLTMFQLFFETEKERRRYLLKFIDILKANGLTALLTNEQSALFPETEIGLENFLTDGNIYLIQSPAGDTNNRYVWVAKMRKQPTRNDLFPIEITDHGIVVYESAAGFSMLDQ